MRFIVIAFIFLFCLGCVVLTAYLVSRTTFYLTYQRQKVDDDDLDDGDKAMAVNYIAARGPATMLDIRLGMHDFTNGEHDWRHEKTERHIYRLLARLEEEGTLSTLTAGRQTKLYRLTAPNAVLPLEGRRA